MKRQQRIKQAKRHIKNEIKPIKDTPENVAKYIMIDKPKKVWDYKK